MSANNETSVFESQISIFAESLNREPPHVDGVRVIILGYGIACKRAIK